MKRIMVFGVFFFAAAALGFGLNLLAVSNALAIPCDHTQVILKIVCDDALCVDPLAPDGVYACGRLEALGTPCQCEFESCTDWMACL